MNSFRPWQRQIRWLPCDNVGVSIPGFSLARSTGVDPITGNIRLAQPNADGQDVYAIGPQSIAAGGSGWCTRDWPAYVQYDPAGGVPAVGDTWGVAAGSFLLTKTKAGFAVYGGAANGRVLVARDPKECCGGGGGGGGGLQRARVTGGTQRFINSLLNFRFDSARWDTGTPPFWSSLNPTLLTLPSDGHYLIGGNVKFSIVDAPPLTRPGVLFLSIGPSFGPAFAQVQVPFKFSQPAITGQVSTCFQSVAGNALLMSAQIDSTNPNADSALAVSAYSCDLWAVKLS